MDKTEIQELTQSNPNSMNKIEWWLLKYRDNYKDIKNTLESKHWDELDNSLSVRLPSSLKVERNDMFINLYESLDALSTIHRLENYFKTQLLELKIIRMSENGKNKWLKKNKHLGADKLACFFIDYLDYDDDDKVEHLKVFIHTAPSIKIFIQSKDFRYTIEFLEIFDKLYWKNSEINNSLNN